MALFRKAEARPAANAVGLVVRSDAPPHNAPRIGGYATGSIRVVVNGRQLDATFRFGDRRWVTRGMEIPIRLDGDVFEVDWDAVGSMAERAAANESCLADPIGAKARVAQAIGVPMSELGGTQPGDLRASLAKAAAMPAPAGKQRAVVLLTSVRGRIEDSGDSDSSSGGTALVTMNRGSEAVLSVNVPGRAPYALFVPKFKIPRRRLVAVPGGLPALVSTTDPGAVEIQWDEMPSTNEQIATRMAASMQRTQQQHAAMADIYRNAVAQTAGEPATGYPMPTMAMPPQARAMLVANLRIALQNVTDPARRQLMIDQYRAMGVEITAEELGF
jgi:hypothetical protein